MNRLCLLLLSLVLVIAARASEGEIAGRVIDALTGKAIARAKVIVYSTTKPADRMVLLTDDQGAFRVLNLPEGPVSLWAQRAGYLGDPTDPPTPESRAQLMISGSAGGVTPVTLKLTPQAVIEGRATDAKGVGIALVRLWERKPDGPIVIHGEQHVDRTGEFRFAPLASGRYFLEVSSLPPAASPSGPGPVYLDRFFEEGAALPAATPIDIESGQTRSLSVPLQSAQGRRIRGRVNCPPSDPFSAALYISDNAVFAFVSPDPETRTFSISNVPPGEYLLRGGCGTNGQQFKSLPLAVSDCGLNGVVLE